jgi:hypothetical protein
MSLFYIILVVCLLFHLFIQTYEAMRGEDEAFPVSVSLTIALTCVVMGAVFAYLLFWHWFPDGLSTKITLWTPS